MLIGRVPVKARTRIIRFRAQYPSAYIIDIKSFLDPDEAPPGVARLSGRAGRSFENDDAIFMNRLMELLQGNCISKKSEEFDEVAIVPGGFF
jgi:hypothetical protein